MRPLVGQAPHVPPVDLHRASVRRVARRPSAHGQLSLYVALALFAAYVVLARLEPELRYTRYALPLALGALWLARRSQDERITLFSRSLTPFAVVTALICAWSAVLIGTTSTFYSRFFEETLFLIAPLSAAMICIALKRHDSDVPFYLLVAILAFDYVWEVGLSTIVVALSDPRTLATDLVHSVAPTESVRAFSLGVLAILLLARRRWGPAGCAVFLALLGAKRIVVVGLLAAAPLAFIPARIENRKIRAAVAIAAVALNLVAALSLRNLDEWGIARTISELTSESADAVLMGRARLFALLSDRLPETSVLGVGLGRITDVLATEGAWLTNVHSDVLKHYIELGPLLFAAWIGVLYWTTRHTGMLSLAVFLNILFLTDNVSIYFDVMFLFYLSFACLDETRHRERPDIPVPCIVRRRRVGSEQPEVAIAMHAVRDGRIAPAPALGDANGTA